MLQQVEVGSILASRYELQALLGRGGMGLVFKALDRTLRGELVALKVLLPGVDLSPEVLARFRDEVKLARKVRHKNVCAIFEYQEDGDYPFIVMELVEGTDLKRALRKVHSLEWEEGFEVAIQVSEGLSAIHEAKIVHRDLKPANITRDKRDVVRVMDFGIALSDTHADFTEMGKVVGTIDYMSPEQFRGVSLDQRSDIYSFGIVIYELFTGRVPFRGDVATIVQKHLTEPPPLHGVAADQIPPSLVPVLERALSKNRNDRFSSATEMSKALQAARDKMRRDGTDPVSGSGGRLGLTPPRPRPVAPYPPQARLLVPALIRALGSPDRGVRLGAADALAHTPDALARPALEKAR
ncbi:MAG TPA: protein kinase, partial [Vicinamibacteria bacterium]